MLSSTKNTFSSKKYRFCPPTKSYNTSKYHDTGSIFLSFSSRAELAKRLVDIDALPSLGLRGGGFPQQTFRLPDVPADMWIGSEAARSPLEFVSVR
jgi:hypothetical protein